MKLTSFLVISALFVFSIPNIVSAEYVALKSKSTVGNSIQNINITLDNYKQAYKNYYLAKNASDTLTIADYYVKAISHIAKANALEKDNISYIALAMQIYRGKGVLPYAKSSFFKSEKILQSEIEKNPNDIAVLLDYAILCYSGDMAYRNEAPLYKAYAMPLAKKVINLTDGSTDAQKIRQRAMAWLILGEKEKFVKILDQGNTNIGNKTSIFYLNLYKKTVSKNTWLWPVADKYIINEYLLYYLCDISR